MSRKKDKSQAVRKITNKGSKTKVIGRTPSYKMGRAVAWESQIERDFIYLLEFDPDVLSYQEQPRKFQYRADGKVHSYTPDLEVTTKDKTLIIEIKPASKAKDDEHQRLFKRVAPVIEAEGFEYRVVTDAMIRHEPQLSNIKYLRIHGRTVPTTSDQLIAHSHLTQHPSPTVSSLMEEFTVRSLPRQTVYTLIYWGVIAVDLNQPLTPLSPLFLPKGISYE
jgi:TnsA endonuclease N terminal